MGGSALLPPVGMMQQQCRKDGRRAATRPAPLPSAPGSFVSPHPTRGRQLLKLVPTLQWGPELWALFLNPTVGFLDFGALGETSGLVLREGGCDLKEQPCCRPLCYEQSERRLHKSLQMKMEEMSLSGLDNSKLEAIAQEIYADLVEDSCLGFCFEVHRAVKCGYFFLDDTDPDSMKDFEIVDQPGLDIFGQVFNQWKSKECVCPNCSRSIAASRFAPHLEKCLGMGRNSSRIANRRIANSNNMNKSESDQEDNDDINDNDWSYGSEKKAKKRKSDKNPNSPRRSKSLKHKNGELSNSDPFKYSNSTGISYETLGPEELRSLLTTQCGVISEHTKKMCTRSLRCPQHTDEQRRTVRIYFLGPSAVLPEVESSLDNDGFDMTDSQALISRLQWDGSSDLSPSDSGSSKTSENQGWGLGTNSSESRKTKKKKSHLSLVGTASGLGSNKKKKPKPPAPPTPSIYDDIN